MVKASVHIDRCRDVKFSLAHNTRLIKPNYILKRENPGILYKFTDPDIKTREELVLYNEQREKLRTPTAITKRSPLFFEGIVNLEEAPLEDLERRMDNWTAEFTKTFPRFKVKFWAIHHDEGPEKPEEGDNKFNVHAHVLIDRSTERPDGQLELQRFRKKEMFILQRLTAKTTELEAGVIAEETQKEGRQFFVRRKEKIRHTPHAVYKRLKNAELTEADISAANKKRAAELETKKAEVVQQQNNLKTPPLEIEEIREAYRILKNAKPARFGNSYKLTEEERNQLLKLTSNRYKTDDEQRARIAKNEEREYTQKLNNKNAEITKEATKLADKNFLELPTQAKKKIEQELEKKYQGKIKKEYLEKQFEIELASILNNNITDEQAKELTRELPKEERETFTIARLMKQEGTAVLLYVLEAHENKVKNANNKVEVQNDQIDTLKGQINTLQENVDNYLVNRIREFPGEEEYKTQGLEKDSVHLTQISEDYRGTANKLLKQKNDKIKTLEQTLKNKQELQKLIAQIEEEEKKNRPQTITYTYTETKGPKRGV